MVVGLGDHARGHFGREAGWWQRSTATRTSWTFGSGPGAGTQLLSVDYLVDLSLSNTVVGSEFGLRVSQQAAGARLWLSYDDGATWQPQPVESTGNGEFQAALPVPPAGSEFVSLRVVAWDADDNRIQQDVIRAWRLPSAHP
jgi:hypothetical protein